MTTRREDARIEREYREYTEALAAVAVQLNRAEAANDEPTYMTTYDTYFTPIYVSCRRTIGADLAAAVVKEAYELARFAA